MNALALLNPDPPRRWKRWLAKSAFVAAVTVLVLYPKPWMLPTHIRRALDPSALINPEAPGIPELEGQARALMAAGTPKSPTSDLRAVERVIYKRFHYAYDWETWGVANYLPTVAETLSLERCDCKGRAVVAASVLRRMGHDARLVSDLSHLWVWTPEGEAMGPQRTASGRRVLDADARGNRVDVLAIISPAGLFQDIPTRIGFSIAVFPPIRTAIIALAVWVAFLARSPRWAWAGLGLVLIGGGLFAMGYLCSKLTTASAPGAWLGIATVAGGLWLSGRAFRSPLPAAAPAASQRGSP